MNDNSHKVFSTTFLQAVKRYFTSGFLMFCNVIKRHEVLVEDLMLFDGSWSQKRENDSGSINERQVL